MATLINDIEKIQLLDSTIYEEESYTFLQYYQYAKDWYTYDSNELGISTLKSVANTFTSFHGAVDFPHNDLAKDFWSSIPLGIFRYKMLSDGSPYLVDSIKHSNGYIVEGVYWNNGFVYLVRDKFELLQIKLFIDQKTKETQRYPDTISL
jgi:hypothetical protein